MNRENIVSMETYKDKKTGENKKIYHTIGEVITFQSERGESKIVKLYSNPNDKYYLMSQREKTGFRQTQTIQPEQPKAQENNEPLPTADFDENEEINIEDVDI